MKSGYEGRNKCDYYYERNVYRQLPRHHFHSFLPVILFHGSEHAFVCSFYSPKQIFRRNIESDYQTNK